MEKIKKQKSRKNWKSQKFEKLKDKNTKIQKYKNTKIEKYKSQKVQKSKYKNKKIQKYKKQKNQKTGRVQGGEKESFGELLEFWLSVRFFLFLQGKGGVSCKQFAIA